jgi:hypothetical protein
VAYIEERKNGWLVVWRDGETGRKRSRLVAWGKPGTAGEDFTKDKAHKAAEALVEGKRKSERGYRKPLERLNRHDAEDYPDWQPLFQDFVGDGEEKPGALGVRGGSPRVLIAPSRRVLVRSIPRG